MSAFPQQSYYNNYMARTSTPLATATNTASFAAYPPRSRTAAPRPAVSGRIPSDVSSGSYSAMPRSRADSMGGLSPRAPVSVQRPIAVSFNMTGSLQQPNFGAMLEQLRSSQRETERSFDAALKENDDLRAALGILGNWRQPIRSPRPSLNQSEQQAYNTLFWDVQDLKKALCSLQADNDQLRAQLNRRYRA